MQDLEQFYKILPDEVSDIISNLPANQKQKLEEVRLRINKPACLVFKSGDQLLDYYPTKEVLHDVIRVLSENSIYAYQEELKQGFITIKGGHRIGIMGKAVIEKGEVKSIRHISGINFRISKEIIGAGNQVSDIIFNSNERVVYNTLILSPPGCGKTTLLRDLTRIFSDGSEGVSPHKVSVIDERSEIAGSFNGIPQKQIGIRTDVLDGCPKAEGIMMAIRAMSPELIVTDEIGNQKDIVATREAVNAGVGLLVSAHSDSIEALSKRPGFSEILDLAVFQRIIILSHKNGAGTIEQVLDGRKLVPISIPTPQENHFIPSEKPRRTKLHSPKINITNTKEAHT